MRTISIIGGAGWLGLPLTKHLHSQGFQVKSSFRSDEKKQAVLTAGASAHQVTLPAHIDPSILDTDVLIICFPSKDIQLFQSLAEKIKTHNITKVIYTSSTGVYAPSEVPVNENTGKLLEGHPLVEVENIIRSTSKEATILRLAGLFDEKRHPGRWFQNKPVPNPNAPVNLIHREDCIGIIDKILKDQLWGRTINACAPDHPSKIDFYSKAAKYLGLHPPKPGQSTVGARKIIVSRTLTNYTFKVKLDQAF